MNRFSERVLCWYDQHGRKDLPWKNPADPYRIWLAEVMLQQTQVATVTPYFLRFVERFDSLQSLAEADQAQVLQYWAGLGYYARGRNLHKAAQIICAKHACEFPRTLEQAMALPGLGRSTAAAVLAQAYDQAEAILDGNVKRVLCRHAGIEGHPSQSAVSSQLWRLSEAYTPAQRSAHYTQGIMDIGALVCTRKKPHCERCPLAADCVAKAKGLTEQLPTPKTRKPRPHRQIWWLVQQHEQRVALQRRPENGLWGGMLAFPEFESYDALLRYSAQAGQSLPPIAHVFTHFSACYNPILVSWDGREDALGDDAQWAEQSSFSKLALPTPVKHCLTQLFR